MSSQNESIMEFACRFAEEINAKAILLYSEVAQDLLAQKDAKTCFDTILITRGNDNIPYSVFPEHCSGHYCPAGCRQGLIALHPDFEEEPCEVNNLHPSSLYLYLTGNDNLDIGRYPGM